MRYFFILTFLSKQHDFLYMLFLLRLRIDFVGSRILFFYAMHKHNSTSSPFLATNEREPDRIHTQSRVQCGQRSKYYTHFAKVMEKHAKITSRYMLAQRQADKRYSLFAVFGWTYLSSACSSLSVSIFLTLFFLCVYSTVPTYTHYVQNIIISIYLE